MSEYWGILGPSAAQRYAAEVQKQYGYLLIIAEAAGRVPPSLETLVEEARRSWTDDVLAVIQKAKTKFSAPASAGESR